MHGHTNIKKVVWVLRRPMSIPRFFWLAVWFLPRGPCSGVLQMTYATIGHYRDVTGVQKCGHECGLMRVKRMSCEMRNVVCSLRWLPTEIRAKSHGPNSVLGANSDPSTWEFITLLESNLSDYLHTYPQLNPILNHINPVHVVFLKPNFLHSGFPCLILSFFRPKFCCF
jgi:hypothetical protein